MFAVKLARLPFNALIFNVKTPSAVCKLPILVFALLRLPLRALMFTVTIDESNAVKSEICEVVMVTLLQSAASIAPLKLSEVALIAPKRLLPVELNPAAALMLLLILRYPLPVKSGLAPPLPPVRSLEHVHMPPTTLRIWLSEHKLMPVYAMNEALFADPA